MRSFIKELLARNERPDVEDGPCAEPIRIDMAEVQETVQREAWELAREHFREIGGPSVETDRNGLKLHVRLRWPMTVGLPKETFETELENRPSRPWAQDEFARRAMDKVRAEFDRRIAAKKEFDRRWEEDHPDVFEIKDGRARPVPRKGEDGL